MADVAIGDVLRVGATWTMQGAYEVTNVWHVTVLAGGGIDYPAASLDIQDYMEDIYTEILTDLSDEMVTDFISLSNETQHTTFGALAWQSPLQGVATDSQTAPGVCLFAWGRTLIPRVQIRKYFGVYTEAGMVDGLWTSALRTRADSAMNIHITPYTGGPAMTLKGVAYNRTLETFTLALSNTTAAEPAYQRRRKRGRGS